MLLKCARRNNSTLQQFRHRQEEMLRHEGSSLGDAGIVAPSRVVAPTTIEEHVTGASEKQQKTKKNYKKQ